jgi:hypothetical protein
MEYINSWTASVAQGGDGAYGSGAGVVLTAPHEASKLPVGL